MTRDQKTETHVEKLERLERLLVEKFNLKTKKERSEETCLQADTS